MLELSVKINNLFGEGQYTDSVRRSAEAGADAIGFRPWYSNELDAVADETREHGLNIAYLSGGSESESGPEYPMTDPKRTEEAIAEIERSISVAAEADCQALNVIPGLDQEMIDTATQHINVVNILRNVADTAEDAEVLLVLEPLNTAVDHPGYFLSSSYHGYEIVDSIDSPNVKLLYDIYHQQITEGNVIQNITNHIDLIGHIHIADVPGRHEPGTGELNHQQIIDAIAETNYDGYIGCEFSPTIDPETTIKQVAQLFETL